MKQNYFLPYYNDRDYLNCLPENTILCTRFKKDFQSGCFLYKESENQTIDETIASEINSEYECCYIYDMSNFENKEFTVEGYDEINSDLSKIIEAGFKYILVSNPYIIELLSNEYCNSIKIVISSQLEINSVQSKMFFEVLNNTSNISHIVLSQNYKYDKEIKKIVADFKNYNLVLEPDRLCSKNQIIHEAYYNIIYGYYNDYTKEYLSKFIEENKCYFKKSDELVPSNWDFSYKLGTINTDKKLVVHNLRNLLENKISNINIIDYYLWKKSVL